MIDTPTERDRIDTMLVRLVNERGPTRSICPSEAAKALGGDDWRPWLKPVRARAQVLAAAGRLRILRKGKAVADPASVKGVIRLSAPEEGAVERPAADATAPDHSTTHRGGAGDAG
ncbi:DUF3253 domain-containing protein [Rhodothalassium salexigens]|nr:DUF3253 domain-containing protein [Rhodothalassium salexigens]